MLYVVGTELKSDGTGENACHDHHQIQIQDGHLVLEIAKSNPNWCTLSFSNLMDSIMLYVLLERVPFFSFVNIISFVVRITIENEFGKVTRCICSIEYVEAVSLFFL